MATIGLATYQWVEADAANMFDKASLNPATCSIHASACDAGSLALRRCVLLRPVADAGTKFKKFAVDEKLCSVASLAPLAHARSGGLAVQQKRAPHLYAYEVDTLWKAPVLGCRNKCEKFE